LGAAKRLRPDGQNSEQIVVVLGGGAEVGATGRETPRRRQSFAKRSLAGRAGVRAFRRRSPQALLHGFGRRSGRRLKRRTCSARAAPRAQRLLPRLGDLRSQPGDHRRPRGDEKLQAPKGPALAQAREQARGATLVIWLLDIFLSAEAEILPLACAFSSASHRASHESIFSALGESSRLATDRFRCRKASELKFSTCWPTVVLARDLPTEIGSDTEPFPPDGRPAPILR
jgi:hypothetical protein